MPLRGREFKDAVFGQFAQIGAAFASPKRIEIIDVLAQSERNVEILARETGLSVANTSRHLQVLKGANLVASRRQGPQVFYRISDPMVLRGYRALKTLTESRLAEVDRLVRDYFSDQDELEPVAKEELLRRVRARDVVVLDVRPREEYDAGHITGALSVPLADLQRRLAELPAKKQIVAYCRGPYCVLSVEAIRLLRKRGFDAVRLAEGLPEWSEAGFPVESTASRPDQEQTKESRK